MRGCHIQNSKAHLLESMQIICPDPLPPSILDPNINLMTCTHLSDTKQLMKPLRVFVYIGVFNVVWMKLFVQSVETVVQFSIIERWRKNPIADQKTTGAYNSAYKMSTKMDSNFVLCDIFDWILFDAKYSGAWNYLLTVSFGFRPLTLRPATFLSIWLILLASAASNFIW